MYSAYLAPEKNILDAVNRIPLSPPMQDIATKIGIMNANGPTRKKIDDRKKDMNKIVVRTGIEKNRNIL